MCIFKQMCQRREGVTVLAVDLHSSAIFKRKGVGGNSGFSLGSFCCFASLLVGFWVVGWWVGCWFVCVFLVLCCCQCYYLLIIECQFTLLFVRLEGEAGKQKKCNYLLKLHTAKMPECFLATRNRKAVHWEFWQYLETGCVDVFGLIPEELQCSRSQRLNMRRLFFYLLVGSREL